MYCIHVVKYNKISSGEFLSPLGLSLALFFPSSYLPIFSPFFVYFLSSFHQQIYLISFSLPDTIQGIRDEAENNTKSFSLHRFFSRLRMTEKLTEYHNKTLGSDRGNTLCYGSKLRVELFLFLAIVPAE